MADSRSVAEIERRLEASVAGAERLALVDALAAHDGDAAAERLLSHYLVSGEDPEAAAYALRILCGAWGRTAEYAHVVAHFVRGVPWDEGTLLRRAAIDVAGEHLASASDVALMYELVRISEDGAEPDEVQAAAVRALARATGYRGKPMSVDL